MATTKNSGNGGSGVRPGVTFIIVAIIAGLVGFRFLGGKAGPGNGTTMPGESPAETAATAPAAAAPGGAAPVGTAPGAIPRPDRTASTAPMNRNTFATTPGAPVISAIDPSRATATAGPAAMLKAGEWEQKLDDILGGNEDEKQKAEKLLEMFPLLPEDGQVEIAQHLSNLLADDRYPALAQTFTNAATPEAVLDVLMADVLNRNNTIKLNTLLDVAQMPNHPKAEEAREVLEVFVDENYGTDWSKWQAAIQTWLKENPDEPEEPVMEPLAPKTPPAAPAGK